MSSSTPTGLTHVLMTSETLRQIIPEVRLRALIETSNAKKHNAEVVDLVIKSLAISPFLPEEDKMSIVEHCLNEDWETLSQLLHCRDSDATGYENEGYERLRAMVVGIFTKSKKVQLLPDDRKRHIGSLIHSTKSEADLMELTISCLQQSAIFDCVAKELIANDVLDKRYDQLLLPDRFDCEDGYDSFPEEETFNTETVFGFVEKEEVEATSIECPVCLGVDTVDTLLPCGHKLCKQCITDWAGVQQEATTCPMCRIEFCLSDCISTL